MKVLIPGGSGLVGRALSQELIASGHSCLILSRRPGVPADLPDGIRVATWDGTSTEDLRPLLEGIDAVVHLMGESIGAGRWTPPRKREILEARTLVDRFLMVYEDVYRHLDQNPEFNPIDESELN